MQIEGANGMMVLLALVAGIGIGAVWYAPPVFGNVWQALAGIKPGTKPGIQSFAGWAASYLVLVVTLAYLFNHMGVNDPYQGARWGMTLGLAVVGPATFGSHLFAKRPFKLFLIDLGNIAIAMGVMGAIIALGR